MNETPCCIMLIDDNQDDNFFHEREIKKNDPKCKVLAKNSAIEALEYLKSKEVPKANLIFLDINMPKMNGWEFLQEYDQLDKELQSQAISIMLTTSQNPDDKARGMTHHLVADFVTKPLTQEKIKHIIDKHFRR